ncbi:hypothetical protein KDD17_17360 [Sulfitobacter albidus]|uniref:Uncharacterized protein n=1 Tax=Sulfitobacter albidus TaxID=2829501 RepID=A0A975PNU1_9RHOB|nr:hypothetical protein [Sulfitobacter albidus]QUJ78109.1 hypothetical protein KDD17_17360 [Sulfitobacter albidus]
MDFTTLCVMFFRMIRHFIICVALCAGSGAGAFALSVAHERSFAASLASYQIATRGPSIPDAEPVQARYVMPTPVAPIARTLPKQAPVIPAAAFAPSHAEPDAAAPEEHMIVKRPRQRPGVTAQKTANFAPVVFPKINRVPSVPQARKNAPTRVAIARPSVRAGRGPIRAPDFLIGVYR